MLWVPPSFCLKIYVRSYEFLKVIKKVVTFFVTKNVFSVDSVCKIKSLWQASNMDWQRDLMWRKIAIQYSCKCWSGPHIRVWDISPESTLHTISLDSDTFGTTVLLIWQILNDHTRSPQPRCWVPEYLCPSVSISIFVPFIPHLPHLEEVDLRLCC